MTADRWSLCVHRLLHVAGIFLFTKGFLLTRLVLDNKSECAVLPIENPAADPSRNPADGCWHPKTFDKAVVLVIDALRYDFTVPSGPPAGGERPHLFHNNFPVLYDTAVSQPDHAFLLPFVADPPTTTLQRLKGLTTGTLPTFVDAGSNFAGTVIDEDNLVTQLHDAGKRIVHLGDDTWHALFPGLFEANLTHPYDSFNVWDLHTVDNGITQHLLPLLEKQNQTKWDVIFGHFLGVDHAGHRYGPEHAAMAAKLDQMDKLVRKAMESIDENTILVILGDHGMDIKGDHGGESDEEIEAALWMYSKKPIFGHRDPAHVQPPATAKERPIPQIDLVPTLALMMGMPIPFNNLGSPIEAAFAGAGGKNVRNLVDVNRVTAAQIKRYQYHYAKARNMNDTQTSGPQILLSEAEGLQANKDASSLWEVYDLYYRFQRDTLSVCRSLWARFDVPSMVEGIVVLFASIILLAFYARAVKGDRTGLSFSILKRVAVGAIGGGIGGFSLGRTIPPIPPLDSSILGASAGGILATASALCTIPKQLSFPIPKSLWSLVAVLFPMAQSLGFASNSYTIWEDQILLFFLTTFGVLAAVSSLRQKFSEDRVIGFYHSLVFIVLGRIASSSRLCRDEQMPYCRSTYYASATSSTSAPWHLLIPFALAIVLPSVIKAFYEGTKSHEGPAVFWIDFALRIGMFAVALFWTLNAADDVDSVPFTKEGLASGRLFMAQSVLILALVAGTLGFAWTNPCVSIGVVEEPGTSKTVVVILGYANIYGTRFCLLVLNFLLAIMLLQKPLGVGAVSIQIWQIFSLLEILDTNHLTTTSAAIGPVILGLLGSFHFFTTGHQAVLSSIQWDTAFIPFTTVKYPWSPLLVIANTFGPQILSAVATPLTVLWKRQIERSDTAANPYGINYTPIPTAANRLLSDVSAAASTHMLYYALVNLATTVFAGHLRRHLMLYRIFSPRFMMAALVLGVVDLVVTMVAVVGVRWSTTSVGDVFGW